MDMTSAHSRDRSITRIVLISLQEAIAGRLQEPVELLKISSVIVSQLGPEDSTHIYSHTDHNWTFADRDSALLHQPGRPLLQ